MNERAVAVFGMSRRVRVRENKPEKRSGSTATTGASCAAHCAQARSPMSWRAGVGDRDRPAGEPVHLLAELRLPGGVAEQAPE